MFGIGMPEFILILAVALIVIGPKKLPEVARTLGKAMGEFKRATNELRSAVNIDDDLNEMKQSFQDVKNATYDSVYATSDKTAPADAADSAPDPDVSEPDAAGHPPADEHDLNAESSAASAKKSDESELLKQAQKDSPDND